MDEENENGKDRGDKRPVVINKTHWGWPAAIIVIVIVGMMLIGGMFAWAFWGGGYGGYWGMHGSYGNRMMDEHGYGIMFGGDRVVGTVTAVDGSSFTVAGDGSTTKVTTDDSTRYTYGNQVKVNDTVMVLGNTSGGTLKADRVVINP